MTGIEVLSLARTGDRLLVTSKSTVGRLIAEATRGAVPRTFNGKPFTIRTHAEFIKDNIDGWGPISVSAEARGLLPMPTARLLTTEIGGELWRPYYSDPDIRAWFLRQMEIDVAQYNGRYDWAGAPGSSHWAVQLAKILPGTKNVFKQRDNAFFCSEHQVDRSRAMDLKFPGHYFDLIPFCPAASEPGDVSPVELAYAYRKSPGYFMVGEWGVGTT